MAEFIEPLAKSFGRLQQATIAVATKSLSNPDEAGAAASEYLRLFGLTALAYLWARMAEISLAKTNSEDAAFYTAKLATARFYMQKLLPQTGALLSSILAGSKPLMAMDEAAF
jgi:butyryl-CoA dehydrogenase